MEAEKFLDDRVTLLCGDCLERMAEIPDSSVDSCVCDPPYGFDFMGKHWDHGVPGVEYWREVYRVLKPGAHVLAFGGTRTYHRMACAVEDAGFEIRDALQWLYGSGFPKSHNVSKGIDKAAGAEREVLGIAGRSGGGRSCMDAGTRSGDLEGEYYETQPATPQAAEWEGWGSALKPACELIVMGRKPLSEKTLAANVLRWRTGALNIDACRVGTDASDDVMRVRKTGNLGLYDSGFSGGNANPSAQGRWPANVVHDGSPEVVAGFPTTKSGSGNRRPNGAKGGIFESGFKSMNADFQGDSGSAARFFYTAKADDFDRMTSDHPTVKPVDLMQYFSRLVTPPGGLILDPFAGTGTTGEAAWREGFQCILIERESEYQDHIRTRMKMVIVSDRERKAAVVAGKVVSGRTKAAAMPLFGEDAA